MRLRTPRLPGVVVLVVALLVPAVSAAAPDQPAPEKPEFLEEALGWITGLVGEFLPGRNAETLRGGPAAGGEESDRRESRRSDDDPTVEPQLGCGLDPDGQPCPDS